MQDHELHTRMHAYTHTFMHSCIHTSSSVLDLLGLAQQVVRVEREVDEGAVRATLHVEVAEEHIGAEKIQSLVDDIFLVCE